MTMYIRWLLLAVLSLAFTLLALVVAPVLPLFAAMQGGPSDNANAQAIEPRLPGWLSWFMTPDNSLWGDTGWRILHCPDHWSDYWGMVQWLWRNPGYGFEWGGPLSASISPLAHVTWSGDPAVTNNPLNEGYCFAVVKNPNGRRYWNLRWVKVIGGYCLNLNLGWKLKTYAEDPGRIKTEPRAMFCLSPRITKIEA